METMEDIKFDIGFKIFEQTGILKTKEYFQTIEDVLQLINKGKDLKNINFNLFNWCGLKTIIIKIDDK
jgi:hypothetical protein